MDYLLDVWKATDNKLLIEIGLTIILIVIFFIVKKIVSNLIRKHAEKVTHSAARATYVIKLSNFGLSVVFLTLIALVWEISFEGLSIYFASFFTIVGVAFFAVWSILSNVTAYAILFFSFPFKIGSKIRVIDGDNSVEGTLDDITFFFITIKLDTGERVNYPNNLLLQKPVKGIKKN